MPQQLSCPAVRVSPCLKWNPAPFHVACDGRHTFILARDDSDSSPAIREHQQHQPFPKSQRERAMLLAPQIDFFPLFFFWREKKGKCQEEIFCVLQLFIKGLKAHVNWEWNIKVQLDAHACFWPVERKEYFHGAQRSGLRLFLSEG